MTIRERQIVGGPFHEAAVGDGERFLYVVERDAVKSGVAVEISGTVMACDFETLPAPIGDAAVTRGRSVVEMFLGEYRLPRVINVDSSGIRARFTAQTQPRPCWV